MKTLSQVIREAQEKQIAIGHFNISDLAALKAIFASAQKLNVPVIIGTSTGEADFIGRRQAAALVKSLRDEFSYPIFINSDHTHSFDHVKEAVAAGYDAILFDGGKLPLEENIKQTREVVQYVKEEAAKQGREILVEGELGYIGSSSTILKEMPAGAAIKEEDLTKPEEAAYFVKETGVDLLAPAVGNIHGMFSNMPEPRLNIERIKAITEASKIPMVLHGGSGNSDEDFIAAINSGTAIVHINTELRLAWRTSLDKAVKENPDEVTPYKILIPVVEGVGQVVEKRLRLFNKL